MIYCILLYICIKGKIEENKNFRDWGTGLEIPKNLKNKKLGILRPVP